MLFEADRHQKLKNIKWSEKIALETIRDIYQRTINDFNPETFWPTHQDESSENPSNKCIYFGAAGTIWALDKIASFLDEELPLDRRSIIKDIHKKYLESPDTQSVAPAYFIGESGILFVEYLFNPSQGIEDNLFEMIKGNIKNPTLEFLWGSPGTMIIAGYIYERTKKQKWRDLFQTNVDYLLSKLHLDDTGRFKIWTQDLYGSKKELVGAGHGFIGNFISILKNIETIDQSSEEIYKIIEMTLLNLHIEKSNLVNWPVTAKGSYHKGILVQWCHGATGVITSLTDYPTNNEKLEEVLVKAGNLIWEAGPLNKEISICHGTDGNGFAFLELYKRTHDQIWLDRARSFAMQAIEQRNGRYSLYTGEPGLALYLMNCITKESGLPLLDKF